MAKKLILIILVLSMGCQNSNEKEWKLTKKEIFQSSSNLYDHYISPDNKRMLVQGEKEVVMLETETWSTLPELNLDYFEDILWHTYQNFLIRRENGYEHVGSKEIRQLEDGLIPTAWSPDGTRLYAYQDDRIYEVDIRNLEKQEIVLDEYIDVEKKLLFVTDDYKKFLLIDQEKIIIVDQSNKVRDKITDIDYLEGITENTIKLSNNEKMITFFREPEHQNVKDDSVSELWIYDIETMKSTKIAEVNGYNLLWKHTNDEVIVYDYMEPLQLVDLNNKDLKQLKHYKSTEKIVGVSWINGTNQVVVVIRKFVFLFAKDVYRLIDTDSGKVIIEKDLGGVSQDLDWSSDGKELFYILDKEDGGKVYSLKLTD
jgi:hypothetical protein